jgi:hypothetical protein
MNTTTRLDEIAERNSRGRRLDVAVTVMVSLLLALFLVSLPF